MALATLDEEVSCNKQTLIVQHVGNMTWGKEEVTLNSTVNLLTKAIFPFPAL